MSIFVGREKRELIKKVKDYLLKKPYVEVDKGKIKIKGKGVEFYAKQPFFSFFSKPYFSIVLKELLYGLESKLVRNIAEKNIKMFEKQEDYGLTGIYVHKENKRSAFIAFIEVDKGLAKALRVARAFYDTILKYEKITSSEEFRQAKIADILAEAEANIEKRMHIEKFEEGLLEKLVKV